MTRPRGSSATPESALEDAATYGIGALAQLTGVSKHVIRMWERRYGALSPGRSSTGRREYDAADLERLRLLARLTAAGHAIGTIASSSTEALRKLAAQARAVSDDDDEDAARRARDSLLQAFSALDGPMASRALARASLAFDAPELFTRVVAPVLNEIGERWAQAKLTVAEEHAASSVIRAHLLGMFQSLPRSDGGPVTVAATPEGEDHDLGALFAAIAAASAGHRVIYLGASLPAEDIASAVSRSGATHLLLSVVALDARAATRELAKIAARLPRGVHLVVGGAGAPRVTLPPGARLASLLDLSPPAG